jgi:probable rRNA maturation factor
MPTSASTKKTAKPKLALAVQYAVGAREGLPTRPQVRRWVQAALSQETESAAEITVRFVAEEEGQALNRDYRGKDYATNVLSFVYESEPVSGDLVLCAPVVAREAQQQNKILEAHYAHLLVHGVLHLQGFDHESAKEARIMEAREREIVIQLGYTDPYRDA